MELGRSLGIADDVGKIDGICDGIKESEGCWLGNPEGTSEGTLEGW